MKKALEATRAEFESASVKTPEYLAWHRLFKREFIKFLKAKGAIHHAIRSPNHFDMSGFFTIGTQIWYFRIEDLRWSKERMLIRTATSYADFTGGTNQYIPLNKGIVTFTDEFDRIVGAHKPSAAETHPYVANTIATMGSWR